MIYGEMSYRQRCRWGCRAASVEIKVPVVPMDLSMSLVKGLAPSIALDSLYDRYFNWAAVLRGRKPLRLEWVIKNYTTNEEVVKMKKDWHPPPTTRPYPLWAKWHGTIPIQKSMHRIDWSFQKWDKCDALPWHAPDPSPRRRLLTLFCFSPDNIIYLFLNSYNN